MWTDGRTEGQTDGRNGRMHDDKTISLRLRRGIINGKCSYSARVTSGIPQGSVLGPILFPEVITACMKLFADDADLFGRVNLLVQATTVQTSLDNAVDLAQIWDMNYHFQKCKQNHARHRQS